jgi:hypothetical protein
MHCVPSPQLLPLATHIGAAPELSQQPPLAHVLPSQQTWPVPPQVPHIIVSGLHARPEAVQ